MEEPTGLHDLIKLTAEALHERAAYISEYAETIGVRYEAEPGRWQNMNLAGTAAEESAQGTPRGVPAAAPRRSAAPQAARGGDLAVSCPFYGASLVLEDRGLGRVGPAHLLSFGESNRCALITSAHSPCWMEVGEQRSPDWAECLRNPEVAASVAALGGKANIIRQALHNHFLTENMHMRSTLT